MAEARAREPEEAEPAGELTLQEVAERLGVHYMTAYRYVRTGQLEARRVNGEWRVRAADLDVFAGRPRQGRGRGSPRWSEHVKRLRTSLIGGDEAAAWQVVERALVGGADPEEVYLRMLGPALRQVGDAWEAGELTVEDEHRATAVASRLIGRLGPRFARPGRHRGTVIVGSAPGDQHALPSAMLADVLRGERYSVIDLGGSTPVEAFVSAAARADSLVAIGLSASTGDGLAQAADAIERLRRACPGVALLLGGPAVVDEATALGAGADGWAADAAGAVRVIESLDR
jgi:excisionase family DNA binding protein